MGSCINKSNDIITIRINEKIQGSNGPSYSKNKKFLSTRISLLDVNTKKLRKDSDALETLYSNNISKILIIPEMRNKDIDTNNYNSIRDILDLFD